MSHMGTDATRTLVRSDFIVIGGGAVAVVLAALTRFVGGGAVLAFLCAALAVTLLASLVARSVEQLGDRFGPVPPVHRSGGADTLGGAPDSTCGAPVEHDRIIA